ncbi:TrmH family RNA methyltransferase [Flavobacterium sp.]|uniref:TrmH family RNA methyltransferase n=1 Tax=Flavobacterium sp. TaxID=239 RepID=UPI002FD94F80
MVSKNQIKRITALHLKKNRITERLFIAEGMKVIQEFVNAGFVLTDFFTTNPDLQISKEIPAQWVTESELKKMSCLQTPNTCLAVFEMPQTKNIKKEGLILALDSIRDPGNLGTIIRLCDWFGIEHLICSEETVDVFNPKVIQSTMGSLARVSVTYTSLRLFIEESQLPVYGAFMEGESIYQKTLPKNCILVMGNEANGISTEIEHQVQQKISIPRFGTIQMTESLNVATATAIFMSEYARINEM